MGSSKASEEITLYHYWRSSSSWRVRAALAYKKIPHQLIHINLLNQETESPEYLSKNPAGTVPTLEISRTVGKTETLIESMAMIDYLDQICPSPALYPKDPWDRAQVIALAEWINSGIHPIQNLPVLQKISDQPETQKKWAQHWIQYGFSVFEKMLDKLHQEDQNAGGFCWGNELTVADCCLIPQAYNANRFGVPLETFPRLSAVLRHLERLEFFTRTHPDHFKPVA